MKYGSIPGVDKPVSRLVLGTMIVHTDRLEESFALLDAAFEAGWNTLDMAHVYGGGNTERAVGRWMKARGHREKLVLLSKGAHPNADRARVTPHDIASDLHDSLARLQTDHLDLYLLHRDDPGVPVGPIVEALHSHKLAGRIRAYGGSNWSHERLREANTYAAEHGLTPFVASSPNYGLAEQVDNPWGQGCVSLGGPANREARAWYARSGMPIFAYSSLGRGFFSGRFTRETFEREGTFLDAACRKAYCHEVNFRRLDRSVELAKAKGVGVADLALAWVLGQPLNVFALVGAANESEIRANGAAAELTLTPEESAWLDLEGERPAHARPKRLENALP
ncbi:MAG: aldo/keto reductase [Spirochaetes bacterium]|nr:aldo/keto reductase [Spirochaetota bacterium]